MLQACANLSESAQKTGIHETLAFELLQYEVEAGVASENAERFLEQIITDLVASLGPHPQPPTTVAEAQSMTQKMAVVLAGYNFLQPSSEEDWTRTIGHAFRPIEFSDAPGGLMYQDGNRRREPFLDRSKKHFYYVDCDIGVLLLMSAAQMIGAELLHVQVPKHSYMQWRLPDGKTYSWDWTAFQSREPYEYDLHMSQVWPPVLRQSLIECGIFMRGQSKEDSRAYFKMVIADWIKDQSKDFPVDKRTANLNLARSLEREALLDSPFDGDALNDNAWNQLMNLATARETAPVSLSLSLGSLSDEPYHEGRYDTLACAYFADAMTEGDAPPDETKTAQIALATSVQRYAIALAKESRDDETVAEFTARLRMMENNELCREANVSSLILNVG